jgi:hypothetical protein
MNENPTAALEQAASEARLAIDLQLLHLCEVIGQTFADEELETASDVCRSAYVQGYQDGAANPFFLDQFGEDEVDVRLLDVWMAAELALELDKQSRQVLVQSLRFAFCRGFLDSTGEKPFGPTPTHALQG